MGYTALSLGIFIFLFTFFSISGPKETENTALPKPNLTQFCQEVNDVNAPSFQAPADNATKTGSEDDETLGTPIINSDCSGRGVRHQLSDTLTTYRLIRKNVPLSSQDTKKRGPNFTDQSCHFDSAGKLDISIDGIDESKYKVFFPQISGEISMDEEIPSRTRGRDSNLLYFIDYGLVFLLHLNEDGTFIEYKGGTTDGNPETFYLADIYQDMDSNRPSLPQDAFTCDTTRGTKYALGPDVVVPEQSASPKPDQLQLQYFVFGDGPSTGSVVNGWAIHCKPAVYLYPPKKQLINVRVYPQGYLTYTDPPYDNNHGWTVNAFPDGRLFTINDEQISNNLGSKAKPRTASYAYLYFESKIHDEVINKPVKGWVIKSEEKGEKSEEWFGSLENHFQKILPELGLNTKQTNDFIEYWKKSLPYSPYYFVGIIDQDNVNEIEKLEITPKPDSVNRVRVYFERLDFPKEVTAPTLKPITYNLSPDSFTVVEWGGMVKNDPHHPFTCSQ